MKVPTIGLRVPLLLLGPAVTAALLLTTLVPYLAQGTGAGPTFTSPVGIAVEASGDLVVLDFGLDAVLRVDPVTGDRTIVSDAGTGCRKVRAFRTAGHRLRIQRPLAQILSLPQRSSRHMPPIIS